MLRAGLSYICCIHDDDLLYQYGDVLYTDTTMNALFIGCGAEVKLSKCQPDLMVQNSRCKLGS